MDGVMIADTAIATAGMTRCCVAVVRREMRLDPDDLVEDGDSLYCPECESEIVLSGRVWIWKGAV